MDSVAKPRKRDPNFSADEKALIAQLVKKFPIIEAKLTDGKSVQGKKQAWTKLTQEFNSHIHVHKRDSATLKRAWDNLKASTRKARALERGNLLRTGGGPSAPPPSSEQGAVMSLVEEAAPVIICEIDNNFDSDGVILKEVTSPCIVISDELEDKSEAEAETVAEARTQESSQIEGRSISNYDETKRKPIDFVRREGTLRIKLLEHKKRIEIQILNKQLEVENLRKETEEIKKEAAKLCGIAVREFTRERLPYWGWSEIKHVDTVKL